MTHEENRATREPVGVFLMHRFPVVRAGLALLIQADRRLELVGETGTADETLKGLAAEMPKRNLVVVVGVDAETKEGAFTLIREIRDRFPAASVMACASKAEMSWVSRSLFAGADGFIDHIVRPDQFLQALCEAAAGRSVLVGPPSEWLGPLADSLERPSIDILLSTREQEVLRLAAEGGTARQIGESLGLAQRTITTHLGRIYGKLGVKSRVAALHAASEAGLLLS